MVNKTIIQGRLTRDPEVKKTQSGISRLLFKIAWSEKYKETETRCFLLCEAWRQTADFIGNYFRKGQEIIIEGHMVTENWGDNETTFCQVDRANFCGSKATASQEAPAADKDGFVDVPEGIDEELPFT